jgi:hypothetical protein
MDPGQIGMPRENNANTAATTHMAQSTVLPDWMKFPTLAEVFVHSPSDTIAYLTAKHKEYQSLETAGTSADRVRARLISASYARTCALLQELEAAAQPELNKNKQPNRQNSDNKSS